MTPKEKAEELVKKFIDSDNMVFSFEGAKECALIAQEILLQKLKELNIVDSFEQQVLFEINVL